MTQQVVLPVHLSDLGEEPMFMEDMSMVRRKSKRLGSLTPLVLEIAAVLTIFAVAQPETLARLMGFHRFNAFEEPLDKSEARGFENKSAVPSNNSEVFNLKPVPRSSIPTGSGVRSTPYVPMGAVASGMFSGPRVGDSGYETNHQGARRLETLWLRLPTTTYR